MLGYGAGGPRAAGRRNSARARRCRTPKRRPSRTRWYATRTCAAQSQIAVKELEIRSQKAQRLPRIDLVAQYALFSRFNNYEDYFRKFQRNNGQIGMSFQMPMLPGPGVGRGGRADGGRDRAAAPRSEPASQPHHRRDAPELPRRAQGGSGAGTARLDLELAREQLSILLAQMQEGRAGLRQVEEARVAETNKWIAFYDAQPGWNAREVEPFATDRRPGGGAALKPPRGIETDPANRC